MCRYNYTLHSTIFLYQLKIGRIESETEQDQKLMEEKFEVVYEIPLLVKPISNL